MIKISLLSIQLLQSKKIQFSVFNDQDVVKLSEFQVTHRDLYTATDRVPVKNGVLDRRLVSGTKIYHFTLQVA